MARCGLRISEVCRLKIDDVNFAGKTIFIEKTKFYKDRLIPVSSDVMQVLRNCLAVRPSIDGWSRSKYLFVSFCNRQYSRQTVGYFFRLKMKELGFYRVPYLKGQMVFGAPCPHSLRHSFALLTVRRWYKEGLAVDEIGDTLATYMGHSCFAFTQIYLKDLSRDPGPLVIHMKSHEQSI